MKRGFFSRFVLALAGVWALAGADGIARDFAADRNDPLQRLMGERPAFAQEPTWFVRADRRGRFLFDPDGGYALLQEERGREVYALRRTRASGGGENWVTDTNEVMLSVSNLGGATYFPPDRPDGVIVEPAGSGPRIDVEPLDADGLEAAANRAAQGLSRYTRNEITVALANRSPVENAFLADTLVMIEIASARARRGALRDIETVRVGVGEAAQARYDGRTLDVSIYPPTGYAGRPSSERLRRTFNRAAR